LIHDLIPDENFRHPYLRISAIDKLSYITRTDYLSSHRKNFYLFVYVKSGSGRYWVDMTPYELDSEAFYFATPEQVHLKEDISLSGVNISFTCDFLRQKGNEFLYDLPVVRNVQSRHVVHPSPAEKGEIEWLLEKIQAEYQRFAELQDEVLFSYIRLLLVLLSRIYSRQYGKTTEITTRESYRHFQDYIELYFKQYHEVGHYANLLHFSTSHLTLLIKEQSGKTPSAHIHDRLILESKRMLFHSALSIKQIAFELGFRDASYFNRFFKRGTGITATAYKTSAEQQYI
jgi:AraC family transcriptional activator of pobA